MLDVLSYRQVSAADIWDEVRSWLEAHGVPAPVCFEAERLPPFGPAGRSGDWRVR